MITPCLSLSSDPLLIIVTRTLVVCITLLWSTLDQLPDSWWLSLSYDPFLTKTTVVCHSPVIHSWSAARFLMAVPLLWSILDQWPLWCVTLLWSTLDQWPLWCVTLLWSTLDQWPEFWCLSFSYDTLLVSDHSWSISYNPLCPLPLIHTWSVTTTLASFTLLSSAI